MIVVVALSGGGEQEHAERPPATETEPRPQPSPPEPPRERPLVVGLTERNASLLWSRDARPDLDPALAPWRDRVEDLRPAYYRLAVDWAGLQPSPATAAQLDRPEDGCLRGRPPCGAYAGIRDTLRAVRSQQRAHGGWEVVVVLYGVPAWAAIGPQGCERPTEQPRSRPITAAGLRGYRRLIRDLLRLADAEGVVLKWWSPWNEPNQPFFISPQRERCDVASPSLATQVYARLTRAARRELARDGGDHELVLGEMAGVDAPNANVTGIAELVRELPGDVACDGAVWAQHAYAERGGEAEGEGPVGQLRRALDRRPCTRGAPIWVTETGVGAAHAGTERDTSPGELRASCRAMALALRRWGRDPRVEAAFQYTFREDSEFPVGLADPRLTRLYPVYDLWRGWSVRGRATRAECG